MLRDIYPLIGLSFYFLVFCSILYFVKNVGLILFFMQHLGVCRAGAAGSSLLSVVQLGQHQPSSGAMVFVGNKTTPTVVVRVITSGNIDGESIYVYQALLLVL